ncbi:10870_t:CDS:1 [Scutellospora calospora]|uniref:10870_t:CDS:1 n=1 Tax=Scutellospora calospora TaxID=85575 RepID=A0ACA9LG16_9GLOM|nr:10870_t:CDS:1 [Scutellospora calospora]
MNFPNEIMISIFMYLYDADLFDCLLVSKRWASISIPILWQDPFKHYKNDKIDFLRKVVCHNLDIEEYFNKDEIPTKEYSLLLFPYLEYVKNINIYHISKVFNMEICNEDLIVYIIINSLFISSKMIENICINTFFYNIEELNEYMKYHRVYLDLNLDYLNLNELENLDNLKGLTLIGFK